MPTITPSVGTAFHPSDVPGPGPSAVGVAATTTHEGTVLSGLTTFRNIYAILMGNHRIIIGSVGTDDGLIHNTVGKAVGVVATTTHERTALSDQRNRLLYIFS